MKFYNWVVWAALPFVLISGCTTTTRSSSLQRDVDSLRMEVADLKDNDRLTDMRGGNSDAAELARLRTQMQQLSADVNSTGHGLSLGQQLDYISARLDRLEKKNGLKALDPVVATTEPIAGPAVHAAATGAATGAAVGLIGDNQTDNTNPYAGATTSVGGSTQPPAVVTTPYDEGKALYDKKNYQAAVSQFKLYLADEPKGKNAAAAQFYIGESFYAVQDYEEAILEYQKVVQGFPKSSQVPTSLLKQGLAFQAIGDKDSAKLLYQKVVRDHPKSYAAGVAKERMKTI